MIKKIIVGFVAFLSLQNIQAQVSINPVFYTIDDSITVTFDASISKPSGALIGASKVYMHSGTITNLSTSNSDWKHTVGNWGKDDGIGQLTSIGNNKWQIKYLPRTYYSIPANETVSKLTFVFRNADGSKEGKDASTGGDIFMTLPISGSGLNVKVTSPSVFPVIRANGDILAVSAQSNKKCNIKILMNDTLVQNISNDSIISTNITLNGFNTKWVKVIADLSGVLARDSFYVTVKPANAPTNNIPNGWKLGINYLSSTSVGLLLYAPSHQYVYVLGDFNDWNVDNKYFMYRSPDNNYYHLQIDGLTPGKEYVFQYWVDGSIKIGDPYCDKVSDPWNDKYIDSVTYPSLIKYPELKTNDIASVLQTAQTPYTWKTTSFNKPANNRLNIYELLVRDFSFRHSYQAIIDSIWYLKKLGINCVELMPITEFEGNESWGYNISYYFATDKYYGPKNKLKELIDTLHANGIAVILDAVFNHSFGSGANVKLWWDAVNQQPAANSPYFNQVAKHPFNVGYDYNHESQATKDFVDSAVHYWQSEFKFDGFRFDLSKGFTQKNSGGDVGAWGAYDASRIALLKRIYDKVKKYNNDPIMILEHYSDNQEEKELADYGFMLWGRLNDQYYEISMGWNSAKTDLNYGYYKNRGWNNAHLVTQYENHDEERSMYQTLTYGNGSGPYSTKDLNTALDRQKGVYTFLGLIPGPKMSWMFGELGYDYSINFNGRIGNKPIRWDYYTDANRREVYKNWAAINEFKNKYTLVSEDNFSGELNGLLKRINLSSSTLNATALGNFDVTSQNINPYFQHTGWWYDYITGDSLNVSNVNQNVNLGAGKYKLYVDKKLALPTSYTDTTNGGGIGFMNIDQQSMPAYIWPNPAKDMVYIELLSPQSGQASYQIFDVAGKVVASNSIRLNSGMNQIKLNIKEGEFNLSKGVYIFSMKSLFGSVNQKIVIAE
ncbi:MAG: DUF4961 domain-containing protein [Bacteroidetes bacterium]|nr:DUF4961 domain-containing protein [Bacteroidota bacterium]